MTRSFIASLVALCAFATAASATELRANVTVTHNVVTLGDIFDDAGDAANAIVSDAPAPGLATEITVSRISYIARRNGLVWHNTDGLSHITVARSGIVVPDAEVSSAIAGAIMASNPSLPTTSKLQVDFSTGVSGIQVGTDDAKTVKVEQIAFNPRNGAFDALLRAPANDLAAPLRRVSGRAYAVIDVPVLTRDIAPGDVVRTQDIDWIRLPADRVGQSIITAEAQLVGMSPRRPLRTGEPLRTMDVAPPLVVTKGATVDMSYVTGSLTLLARGQAMQSGAVGDTVDVLNPRSNRTVQGTVEGPNLVRIDVMGAPALTDLKS